MNPNMTSSNPKYADFATPSTLFARANPALVNPWVIKSNFVGIFRAAMKILKSPANNPPSSWGDSTFVCREEPPELDPPPIDNPPKSGIRPDKFGGRIWSIDGGFRFINAGDKDCRGELVVETAIFVEEDGGGGRDDLVGLVVDNLETGIIHNQSRGGMGGGGTTIRILREKEGVSGTNHEGHYRLNTLVIFVMALVKTAMGSVNRPGMTPVTVCNKLDPVSPVSLRFNLKEHV